MTSREALLAIIIPIALAVGITIGFQVVVSGNRDAVERAYSQGVTEAEKICTESVRQAAMEFRANGCCFNVSIREAEHLSVNGADIPDTKMETEKKGK